MADLYNSRIQKFTNDGTYLTQWGMFGSRDGQFNWPVRLAIGLQGHVYVVDHLNARVQVFTSEGAFVTKWGTGGTSPGQFIYPIGIAIDATGDIYVADTNNSRIQKFGSGPTPVLGVTWGALKGRYRGEHEVARPETQAH